MSALGLSLTNEKVWQILSGLNQVKNKYFEELSSPTSFRLSKYAMELSLPTGTEKSNTADTESGQHITPGKRSLWSHIKAIADSIRGYLGDIPTTGVFAAESETGTWEETQPLIKL